jgi:hypothetical protein
MKLTIDFDTANDTLVWQETDEDLASETRIFDHWIRSELPFKNAVRIVLTEVYQADGEVTRECTAKSVRTTLCHPING